MRATVIQHYEPFAILLRVGQASLKTGSECSFTRVNSASSPVFA
jgi:hypothetical protein